MKNIYSFILGHSPELSFAEIKSVLENQSVNFSIIISNDKFLVLETEINLDINYFSNTLGGITKIGKIEFFINKLKDTENIKNTFVGLIEKKCDISHKVKFGFSFYDKDKDLKFFVDKLSMIIKKSLKEKNISSRVVISKEDQLSSVIVRKEHMIESGFDMQVLKVDDKIYFSRTLSVQDFERFNALDYDRPKVDSISGMMPPKLAKIMLNLSNSREIILDPFCGSGTILILAGELNFKKIIGSDISEKAIVDSIENLKWYEERFDKKLNCYVFKSDIIELIKEGVEEKSIDSIVTEGYLGKPIKGNETIEFIKNQIEELKKLYLDSFNIFAKVLKQNSSVVISMPVYHTKSEDLYLDILSDIEKLGFEIKQLTESSKTLIYKRDDQKVYREIVKLIKN
ncbi:MAG: methyltransferase domain-containing protein [Patescibacteria group bacterium]|nr:methyltransferase domain-containing protein [Patescibacteria group bacterium]MDD4304196.1 methyltransferase domain-containing protein [Patescibacteria group bacterium]MDD4695228.1 methyltransferase domain-containing protein [Patescibacteria group bacterium]